VIPSDNVLFTFTRWPRALSLGDLSGSMIVASEERGLDPVRLVRLAENIRPEWFPWGAVIDLQRLLKLAGTDDVVTLDTARLARVKLQGTDGIRGRVIHEDCSRHRALDLLLNRGILTPAFFQLNAEAFGYYLRSSGSLSPGKEIVIGEDGRDGLTGGNIVSSVIRGLRSAGCSVFNTGIIPTPGVPIAAARWGCRGGIIITASHNPSNQNGIKLIHDGFKLMDDGPRGEFGLTRIIYALAEENSDSSADMDFTDIHKEATKLLERVIKENLNFPESPGKPVSLVYDGANGAFSSIAPGILESLPVNVTLLNIDAEGVNINQNGGVGEIEGTRIFPGNISAEKFDSYFPVVREVFRLGRANTGGYSIGIVNDGDGDRGYLLVYNPESDDVLVVPGDELAMLILKKRSKEGLLKADATMVNSVESDIMAAQYARAEYGVTNEIACVGDKWLLKPVREGRPFVVGCEESGHVTFGVDVPIPHGEKKRIFTGNGLLSTLQALEYAVEELLSPEEIARPFPQGFKAIRYVYFVDKERFLPGTEAFISARETALRLLGGSLHSRGMNIRAVDFPDAPEMMYIGVYDSRGTQVGALFARNSGTESKTGVAVRCRKDLENEFREAMDAVHFGNVKRIKDENLLEAKVESFVLEKINRKSSTIEEMYQQVRDGIQETFSFSDFEAVIYAMRKQNTVILNRNRLSFNSRKAL